MAEPAILFVTRKWAPATGGMETYCVRLTEALAEHEPVEVVALSGGTNGMPPGPLALLTFPLTALARGLRRRTAPRILHLGDMAVWPLAMLALLWRGTRVVLSAHGTDVAYHRRGGIRGSLFEAYLRLGSRVLRDALVIANSQATRAAAEETGWRNISVVALGTDLTGPEPDGSHDGSILFAGRLVERKGCGWFVREVMPLLPGHMRLKVAGTAWHASEAAVLDHPRVDFLGPLPQHELARAYAAAMCVIVPNVELPNGEFEGFGLVACEAASCGGVVLAARTGGLVSAVVDGKTGLLVESGNSAAWAQAIAEVAAWSSGERRRFTSIACKTAAERFDWRRVAAETLAAYGHSSAFIEEAVRHG